MPLYEVIRGNVSKLYGGMKLTGTTLFRLTRDAEVEIDDDSDRTRRLREVVREQVRQRRYEPVVRLEFAPGRGPVHSRDAAGAIRAVAAGCVRSSGRTGLHLFIPDCRVAHRRICAIRPGIHCRPPRSKISPDIFAAIREADVLVHHPYESFEDSVEHFIAAAAVDPQTVAVKMTAYRVGDDTPFVKSLVKAAEGGKQVACVIEIKARFDEERNLHWAAELERAGAHVTFGVQGLKTHAKVALVVRQEASGLRSYVHIGTGNYHVRTARLYADLGLFTCDPGSRATW